MEILLPASLLVMSRILGPVGQTQQEVPAEKTTKRPYPTPSTGRCGWASVGLMSILIETSILPLIATSYCRNEGKGSNV
jgi:hypothetical protein